MRVFAILVLAVACGAPAPRLPAVTSPRGDPAGLRVHIDGDRTVTLEVRIDASEASTRRLVARGRSGETLWVYDAGASEELSDFAVHPSGEITLALDSAGGMQLVRLRSDGSVALRQALEPTGIPEADFGISLTPAQLRMKTSEGWSWALTDGWIRVAPIGEDVAVAWLTTVTTPEGQTTSGLATGVSVLVRDTDGFSTRWARLADPLHTAQPAAWTYDEFRWRDAAVRPLLAVFADGGLAVGRAWNVRRCLALAETFGEFDATTCRESAPGAVETEYLPLAITTFTGDGTRAGTRVFVPEDVSEFVAFELSAGRDTLAVAGSAVRLAADGTVTRYPPAPGEAATMVPYDGYVAVLERGGALRCQAFLDGGSGRGDVLSGMRVLPDGTLIAAGATGWDRWYGGMSISRGAQPWLVRLDGACKETDSTVLPIAHEGRHDHLLDADARDARTVAVGLSDAPMTHSGDGGQIAQRMFGGLRADSALK